MDGRGKHRRTMCAIWGAVRCGVGARGVRRGAAGVKRVISGSKIGDKLKEGYSARRGGGDNYVL